MRLNWKGTYHVTKSGEVFNRFGKRMKSFDNGRGYQIVSLRIDGNYVVKSLHRLVAEVYLENSSNLTEVNHEDGCKTNNNLDNLSWCTRSQNIQHCYDKGLRSARGSENSNASLNEETVTVICCKLQEGFSPKDISSSLCVSYNSVRKIKSRFTWKHISKDYSW